MAKLQKNYFQIPNEIIDDDYGLNIYQKMVYIILSRYANQKETAYPSYATIARKSSISKRQAIETIKELTELGLIDKNSRFAGGEQMSNIFTLNLPTDVGLTKKDAPKKLKNQKSKASNINTLHDVCSAPCAPGVVHSMHQGSAPCAPGVVHSMHQGSAPCAPKEELIKNNNIDKKLGEEEQREKEGQADSLSHQSIELCKYYEQLKPGQSITTHLDALKIMIEAYGFDWCKEALQITVSKKGKFIQGYMEAILQNWTTDGKPDNRSKHEKKKAEQNEVHYDFSKYGNSEPEEEIKYDFSQYKYGDGAKTVAEKFYSRGLEDIPDPEKEEPDNDVQTEGNDIEKMDSIQEEAEQSPTDEPIIETIEPTEAEPEPPIDELELNDQYKIFMKYGVQLNDEEKDKFKKIIKQFNLDEIGRAMIQAEIKTNYKVNHDTFVNFSEHFDI